MEGMEERVAHVASDIIVKSLQVLLEYPLCDRCLGRMFALLGKGWSNKQRGEAIKMIIIMVLHRLAREGDEEASKLLERLSASLYNTAPRLYEELGVERTEIVCPLCGGVFDKVVNEVVERAARLLREVEAESFVVGARLAEEVRGVEDSIVANYGLVHAESIAAELKREVGKRLRDLGFSVDFSNPDVTLLVEYPSGRIEATINPILILGFYKKTARRVSQSSWITSFGVKRYPFSVQDAYTPLLELYKGSEIVIHAAGREDVDVRMLGSGRPIVVEVKEPRRRRVKIEDAERSVNDEWVGLFKTVLIERVTRSFMRSVVKGVEGEERHAKIYRALVYVPDGVSHEDIEKLVEFFKGRLVRQRTPRRVRHRRADIIRERKVYEVSAYKISDNLFIAFIRAEGGLYIKELVSGEDTWPGFPDALGKQAHCVELDVVKVETKLRVKEGLVSGAARGGVSNGKATQGLSPSHKEASTQTHP
ncbi:THUMP domain-containing protein [Pyrolobus fumarii 1A]|uniref:tRNA pseudouridine synthase Pus10 n=1 Tax=Pyrolobus fumarii (strain DSM 11204 / 1A) TaxID=694429 RepID=G0EEJ7_PYRF1|nr:tRNA pseudouridine(54/55) synthase Pus10 [Pyrolobus fumarii]AEM38038.1 THUMP domain-containing protein [Pyrolobus fumarii 1A]